MKKLSKNLAFLLVFCLFCPFLSAQEVRDPFWVEFVEVQADIWVARRPRPERQPVMGNGTIIINDDHVVVIDGNGSPLLAERVIEGIQRITDKPVRRMVVTHWHGDHNLGNRKYLEAWPDMEIIATRFTHDAMTGAPMDYVQEIRESLGPQLETLREYAATGKGPDGKPLPEYMRADYYDLVQFDELIMLEIQDSEIIAPTRTFETSLVLDEGGRTIELHHFGPGNTAGDAVAWLPDEGILVTGDTIVAPTPYGFGSYPASWVQVLRRFKALGPRIIIPGHGPVMKDRAYIDLLIETLSQVAREAEKAVTSGRTLDEFRASFDWMGIPYRFTGNDPVYLLRFNQWFRTPILEAAHNEARGVENEPLYRTPE